MSGVLTRIGLLGAGTVGTAVAELIAEQGSAIAARTGLRLELTLVAVSDRDKARPAVFDDLEMTADAARVVNEADVDVIVEVMGGVEPARSLVLAALSAGKPVVTANKELVANVGPELFAAAEAAGVDLLFEAAVAGAIPIVRPLRESLAGERVRRVTGIVNGTTNFILTRMSEDGADYQDALAEAQRLGFAEADPTADVEGLDAAAKIAIIASIAFGVSIVASDVARIGITAVTAADIDFAHRHDYEIKLLAVAEQGDDQRVSVRVHPALVPRDHPLASVRDSYNAVFVEGDAVGELMFYGRGAGGRPTAAAVLGDVIDAGLNLSRGSSASIGKLGQAVLTPIDEVTSAYFLDVEVFDRPGVLHAVAGVFADHGVSIRSMEQEGLGDEARLFFITHEATEAAIAATRSDLGHLEMVDSVNSVLRVLPRPGS